MEWYKPEKHKQPLPYLSGYDRERLNHTSLTRQISIISLKKAQKGVKKKVQNLKILNLEKI